MPAEPNSPSARASDCPCRRGDAPASQAPSQTALAAQRAPIEAVAGPSGPDPRIALSSIGIPKGPCAAQDQAQPTCLSQSSRCRRIRVISRSSRTLEWAMMLRDASNSSRRDTIQFISGKRSSKSLKWF